MTYPAKQISITIKRSSQDVYEFASQPENLPKWAAGLARSTVKKSGNSWIADSPMGLVTVKFTETNRLGVMDHDVTLPSGEVVHNPLRVLKNGDGCEVVFTLFQLPRMSEEGFKRDAGIVEKDLQKLKSLLEQK